MFFSQFKTIKRGGFRQVPNAVTTQAFSFGGNTGGSGVIR